MEFKTKTIYRTRAAIRIEVSDEMANQLAATPIIQKQFSRRLREILQEFAEVPAVILFEHEEESGIFQKIFTTRLKIYTDEPIHKCSVPVRRLSIPICES